MSFLGRLFSSPSKPVASKAAERYDFGDRSVSSVLLLGNDRFDFEVVGEAHCQDALENICGGKTEDGVHHECVAVLAFDNGNEHDSNAVAVFVLGQRVGYLPRAAAKAYRNEIDRLNPRRSPVGCRAVIRGGWHRGYDDTGHFGITLDVEQPLRLHEYE